MVKPRYGPKLVVVNLDVMAIGGDMYFNNDLAKSTKSVEIYLNKMKNMATAEDTSRWKFVFLLLFFHQKVVCNCRKE